MIGMIISGIVLFFVGVFYLYAMYEDMGKKSTVSLDGRGYERNGHGRLIHRDIAYKQIYKKRLSKRRIY